MPTYNTNAIVLHRLNFSETDRIVRLYSRERGKIAGIAKGARKPVSRLAGATEVLTYGRFHLAEGRNLDIISQVEVKESFPRIHQDLYRIAYTTYIAELVDKMLEEHEPNPDVFDLMLSALYLTERPNDPEKIAHMFELQFMKELGYEPELEKCLRCRSPLVADELQFSPSLGGTMCGACGPLPEDAVQISHAALEAMQKLLITEAPEVERMEIPPDAMDQIARVMRWYVRYRSERELKSLAFLQTLKLGTPKEQ